MRKHANGQNKGKNRRAQDVQEQIEAQLLPWNIFLAQPMPSAKLTSVRIIFLCSGIMVKRSNPKYD